MDTDFVHRPQIDIVADFAKLTDERCAGKRGTTGATIGHDISFRVASLRGVWEAGVA